MRDGESIHFPSLDGVVSRVTNAYFLGRPSASSSPNPSAALTDPKDPSRRVMSSFVIAGIRPDISSLFVMTDSAMYETIVKGGQFKGLSKQVTCDDVLYFAFSFRAAAVLAK